MNSNSPQNPSPGLRVLHVNGGNLFGGVETILLTLARLRDCCPRMESHFALCHEGRLSRELTAVGAPVHLIGNVRVSRPWTVLRARARMRRLLRQVHFDAVVCHMTWSQAIFGPVVRARGIPLIFYLHNRAEGKHFTDRWARWAAQPDLAVCVSRDTETTCRNVFPTAPTKVIYSPIPLNKSGFEADRPRVRRELNVPEGATVIVQVSRMEAWKGHASLLEALHRLREREDWQCWIVGGPQASTEIAYAQHLKDLAAELGVAGRVRFLGERSDVPKLLAAADIMCQPNTSTEGFSIVFMEGCLASLPIITTAIGGALEIVDDSTGILVPLQELDTLTESLRRLLDDRELRVQMGRAGYRRVNEMCDPASQLQKLAKTLSSVAHKEVDFSGDRITAHGTRN
jgi:glycosyltransferase involved in cell wall biosynthesis